MIVVQWAMNGSYELFYRHCDGYATGLGVELIEALKSGIPVEQILRQVGAEPEHKYVEKPEDAFLTVQGDLEWIYVIRDIDSDKTRNLEIIKTSCPYFWQFGKDRTVQRNFAFPVWFSYVCFFPEDYKERMREVELMAEIAIHCLEAYAKSKEEITVHA